MRTRTRRAAAFFALAGMLVVAAPFIAPAAAASCGGRITQNGNWTTAEAPRFSSGRSELTAYGVDPADGNHLYATNGTVVATSRDGGCKWKETYAGEGLTGVPGSGYTIRQIVTPSTERAVLVVEQNSAGSTPQIVISQDRGQSWTVGGAGLPPSGQPELLVTARTTGALFLAVDLGGGPLDLIYVSVDWGATWLLRSDLTDLRANAGIRGISVDDLNPAWVWAWGTGGLYRSLDGGARFTPIDDFVGSTTEHLVGRGGEDMVFLPDADPAQGATSQDNGQTWFRIVAPGRVTSVEHGPASGFIVATAAGRAWIYNPQTFAWFDLEAPASELIDIQIHLGGGLSLFVRNSDSILKMGNATPPGGPLPGTTDPELDLPPLVESPEESFGRSSLGPDGRRIVLRREETKKVTYNLKIPRRQLPLDVYFLIDTSSSMTRTIEGLARSVHAIAQGLQDAGLDVEFGLAEYRSYPSKNPPDTDEKNFVYRQAVDIPAPLPLLTAAIESLKADVGGFYDAHLGALKQTATGEGQDVWPEGVPNKGDVPRGLQADFRDKTGALRVVINATDEAFGSSEDRDTVNPDISEAPPPEIPSFEEVIADFNAKNIRHVGLSISRLPYDDLIRMSEGTETFATGPVDCDGNGTVDVRTGDPLVCLLRSNQSDKALNLVPGVVGLLNAIQQKVPVSLEATSGDQVVQRITPSVHRNVILQTANQLSFEVVYRCKGSQAGKRFKVELRASTSEDIKLDRRATATVVCKDEALPSVPVTPLTPLLALALPPPPPPPAPLTQVNPATQAQTQAQAQGAAAQQRQEEAQLATVTAFDEFKFEEEAEFAMTAYGERRTLPAEAYLGVGIVALGMMASAAYALRHRHQIRHQVSRNRF